MQKPETLEDFINLLIRSARFNKRGEIAKECGITDTALSLAVKGNGRGTRRLSVEACLRLARHLEMHPAYILTIAGRKEIAAIAREIWPATRRDFGFTRTERERVIQWRQVSVFDRHHLDAMLKMCAERTARTGLRAGGANARPTRTRRKK